ncbi:rplp0 MGC53408 arbp [Scophthalmus maximus]|uniref:Large ribosomal subunit protein uL10 n=1 Tax=Scophthalmus maximus TaxID=52904 RepID=A0A2U9BGL3_SCOMX|nr:rplp0 MGC53408 arbp [Scophthalmus maximus]
MPREDRATWKSNYFIKIIQLLDDFPKCFIVGADNVGSKQMQTIRLSLRGKAVVLMGKNTMMRKAIRGHLENNPALEKLLPHIKGNVGFVFTKEDLAEIRDLLLENKVPAAARAGAIAPCDVTVPAQNTGLGPEKTSFFQALGITTKISRGTIEILSDVGLIKTGDKVKAFLADPSAFAAVAAPAAAAEAAAPAAAAKEEVKEESEESDDDMGFGLFD